MSQHSEPDATQLPEPLETTVHTHREAAFDCGDWREGDEEDYGTVHRRLTDVGNSLRAE